MKDILKFIFTFKGFENIINKTIDEKKKLSIKLSFIICFISCLYYIILFIAYGNIVIIPIILFLSIIISAVFYFFIGGFII